MRVLTDLIIPYCIRPLYINGYDLGYIQLEIYEQQGMFVISIRELRLLEQTMATGKYESQPFALLDPELSTRPCPLHIIDGRVEKVERKMRFLDLSRLNWLGEQFRKEEYSFFSGEIVSHPQIMRHWAQGIFRSVRADELQGFLDAFSAFYFGCCWPRGAWTLQFEVAQDLSIAVASTVFTPGMFDGYGLLFRKREQPLNS